MKYFKQYFKDTDFDKQDTRGEVAVKCPFHQDSNPSASVNIHKESFYCFVCGEGYTEVDFIKQTTDLSTLEAQKLLNEYKRNTFDGWDYSMKPELWTDEDMLGKLHEWGLDNEFIDTMRLGKDLYKNKPTLAIPVFFNGTLMDIRRYNINKYENMPKMIGNNGATAGWVIPFDTWKTTDDTTYIVEGEKDMLLARHLGLNAICLTGGANALPNEFVIKSFVGKDIVIMFDNDKAGREGARRLANTLVDYTKNVSILDMAQFVKEEKEDFFDFIHKYKGSIFDILVGETTPFVKEEVKVIKTKLSEAIWDSLEGEKLVADVSVIADLTEVYSAVDYATAEKIDADDDNGRLDYGELRQWTLTNNNIETILDLIEVDAKSSMLLTKLKTLMGIDPKEKGIAVNIKSKRSVYRCSISDLEGDTNLMSVDLYSFEKMEVGMNYTIEYSIFSHGNKNQKIVAIATKVEPVGEIENFVPIPAHLSLFQKEGTVEERLKHQYENAKNYVASHMNFDIWFMTDLVFNSILDFDYGGLMRGALDVFLLGDTQVGKSETTSKMTELYDFGHFISLKTSTTRGLIGGSKAMPNGGYQNSIGSIPRQHKKLVVLEEFSGAEHGFIKNMTDIRSSNLVRISRVSGELTVPCKLRMITISNPLNDDNGLPRNLSSFPNGVIPLMELIKSAEDITRYDGFLLCPTPNKLVNPFASTPKTEQESKEIIPVDAYRHRIRWSYTRTPQNISFAAGVESYIWEQAQELNEQFSCHVPIFGTTTYRKLARFSVALASLLINSDDYENIVVTHEIVDYMVKWLRNQYSSNYFRLDKVKKEWQTYTVYSKSELRELNDIRSNNQTVLEHLSSTSRTSRQALQSLSGLTGDNFSTLFNSLARLKAIRLDGNAVYPSEKFRAMYRELGQAESLHISKYEDSKDIIVDFDNGKEIGQ